ncbi:alpha/beta fold hydrolase [Paractinoplanes durhamensis]|uniref:alpha/beta fold hydrolase n=1 Tax=Paractinoplanes durhamensis TaxID=113563 RepID=UPI003644B080
MVLLHGLLFDRTMWWPAAADLVSPRCTVVAPDLPGHGDSPRRDSCRVDSVAGELAKLVDDLGLHRAPVVVGHATAAPLAEAFAAAYRAHHLLILDEPPPGITAVDDILAAARLDAVPAVFRPYARPRHDPGLLQAYASWLDQPPTRRDRTARAGRPLTDPQGFAAQLRDLL